MRLWLPDGMQFRIKKEQCLEIFAPNLEKERELR
jgi:hypothetical protein